jgi:hypothetical protein
LFILLEGAGKSVEHQMTSPKKPCAEILETWRKLTTEKSSKISQFFPRNSTSFLPKRLSPDEWICINTPLQHPELELRREQPSYTFFIFMPTSPMPE